MDITPDTTDNIVETTVVGKIPKVVKKKATSAADTIPDTADNIVETTIVGKIPKIVKKKDTSAADTIPDTADDIVETTIVGKMPKVVKKKDTSADSATENIIPDIEDDVVDNTGEFTLIDIPEIDAEEEEENQQPVPAFVADLIRTRNAAPVDVAPDPEDNAGEATLIDAIESTLATPKAKKGTKEPAKKKVPVQQKPPTVKSKTKKPATEELGNEGLDFAEPDTKASNIKKPRTEKPRIAEPNAAKPVAKKVRVQKQPPTAKPETPKPAAEELSIEALDFAEPDTKAPDIKKPRAEELRIEEPDAAKPVAKKVRVQKQPPTAKPETPKPAAEELSIEALDFAEPDTKAPDIKKPRAEELRIEEPDAAKPVAKKVRVQKQPAVAKPETQKLAAEELSIEALDFAEPDIKASDIKKPRAEELRIEEPDAAKPVAKKVRVQKQPATAKPETPKPAAKKSNTLIPDTSIFRMYDIRGISGKQLNPALMKHLGRAIGSMAIEQKNMQIVTGRDGRNSGAKLSAALIEGLLSTGVNVIDIGMVPSPVLYFAIEHLKTGSGVMLTGSHNPPEYNGLKIVINNNTLFGDDIQSVLQRVEEMNYRQGSGKQGSADITEKYIKHATADTGSGKQKKRIVIDAGNGVAGETITALLKTQGHEVIQLHCDVDGNFPNHPADPSQPENMEELAAIVAEFQADIGFAFDGDGDRLGVVDSEGKIIHPDRLLMLFAQDILAENSDATVIYDIKCSKNLNEVITQAGGKALLWKTGHSLIKQKIKETDALLAGELSGHLFFNDRWYGFDDALYAALRVTELLTKSEKSSADIFSEVPEAFSTLELRLPLAEAEHASVMAACKERITDIFGDATVIDIDGLRIELDDSWGLIRSSNTSPFLILRFEGDTQDSLQAIQEKFRTLLTAINPQFQLPF